eukprot:scaffold2552_cov380-Prasinococcus_capsulatus_cf.AAC.16
MSDASQPTRGDTPSGRRARPLPDPAALVPATRRRYTRGGPASFARPTVRRPLLHGCPRASPAQGLAAATAACVATAVAGAPRAPQARSLWPSGGRALHDPRPTIPTGKEAATELMYCPHPALRSSSTASAPSAALATQLQFAPDSRCTTSTRRSRSTTSEGGCRSMPAGSRSFIWWKSMLWLCWWATPAAASPHKSHSTCVRLAGQRAAEWWPVHSLGGSPCRLWRNGWRRKCV